MRTIHTLIWGKLPSKDWKCFYQWFGSIALELRTNFGINKNMIINDFENKGIWLFRANLKRDYDIQCKEHQLQFNVFKHKFTIIQLLRTRNNHNNHDNILVEHCDNQSNNNTEITLSSPVRSDDPILSLHQLPALTCPDPPLTARTIPGIFSSSAERAGSDTEWSTPCSSYSACH